MSSECGGPHSSDEGSPPTTLSGCCGWLPHHRPSRKRSAVKHEGGVQRDVSSIAPENLPSRCVSVLPPPPPLILNSELDVINNTQPASFHAPPYTSSSITASPGRSLLAIIDSHSRNTSNLPGRHSHGLRSSAGISSALSDRLSANTSRGRGGSRHSYRSDRFSLGLRSSAGEGGTSALFFQTRSSTGNGSSLSRLSDHRLRAHDASVRTATSDVDDDTSSLASALVTGWLQDQGGQLSNVLEHPDTSDLAKVDFAETTKEMQMESYEDIYQRHVGVLPGMSFEEGEVQSERDSVRGTSIGRSLSVEAPISDTSAFAPHLTPSDHTPSHPTSALLSQNALLPSSTSVPTTSSSGAFVWRSVGSSSSASKPSNLKAGSVVRGSSSRPWSRLKSHDTATTQQEQQQEQQQDAASAHSHLRRPASHHHASSNRSSRPSVTFAAHVPDTSIRHSGGRSSQAERTMPGTLDTTTPGADPPHPGLTGVESSAYSNMASPSFLLGPRLASSRTLQMLLGVSSSQSGVGTRRHTNRSSGSAVSSNGAAPTSAAVAGGHRKDFILRRFVSGRVTPQPEWGSASHMEGYEEPVVNTRPSAPGSVNARPSAPGSVNARPSAPGSVNARPSAPGNLPLRRPSLVTDRSGEIVAESPGFVSRSRNNTLKEH
ncbi:hypothetical protein CEUSTIGMA_g7877.t1 [Chlamydomonas eustigma]|uniref:Uncharacterized protein n=1 Tax=Chlamydomonas eustigma TaxID=1157962 RepID=A0A250XBI5_9CHLO|nr:hypothetical protein CEUSTIGMA_g7877.t1 [Chlamydomonas eustigma]|eukprot:GAX80438.1 hypothetical protein CEUSTIGMA_g7877.t1 [Chlamydomonas eustigma]